MRYFNVYEDLEQVTLSDRKATRRAALLAAGAAALASAFITFLMFGMNSRLPFNMTGVMVFALFFVLMGTITIRMIPEEQTEVKSFSQELEGHSLRAAFEMQRNNKLREQYKAIEGKGKLDYDQMLNLLDYASAVSGTVEALNALILKMRTSSLSKKERTAASLQLYRISDSWKAIEKRAVCAAEDLAIRAPSRVPRKVFGRKV